MIFMKTYHFNQIMADERLLWIRIVKVSIGKLFEIYSSNYNIYAYNKMFGEHAEQ